MTTLGSNSLHLLRNAVRAASALQDRLEGETGNLFSRYNPYALQRVFHAAGAFYDERLVTAGNQLGKTYCGAFETGVHLTGKYPNWWQGRRFDRPTRGWAVAGDTKLQLGGPQRYLLGADALRIPSNLGKAFIPKADIVQTSAGRGEPGSAANVVVRHVSGGSSYLQFMSAKAGREGFQSETLDFAWCDEEIPMEVYEEILLRIASNQGALYTTFTPLKGITELVKSFWDGKATAWNKGKNLTVGEIEGKDKHITQIGIDHVPNRVFGLGPKEDKSAYIAKRKAKVRKFMWGARFDGDPRQGVGAVFDFDFAPMITRPLPHEPSAYYEIGGIDFGIDHPTAFVRYVYDNNHPMKAGFITHEYRVTDQRARNHAFAIKGQFGDLPISWPHDGLQRDKGSGRSLESFYRRFGLNFAEKQATTPQGVVATTGLAGLEGQVAWIYDMLYSGDLKIYDSCTMLQTEMSRWSRETRNGRSVIVDKDDDLIAAMRYAIMGALAGYGRPIWKRKPDHYISRAQVEQEAKDASALGHLGITR